MDKMNTEQAIEFLEEEISYKFQGYTCHKKELDEYEKKKWKVITLLKEDNKYKKMWKEMYNLMKDERLTKIVDSMNDIKAVANDEA